MKAVKKINDNHIMVKCYDYINGYKQFSVISAAAGALVGKELKILKNDVRVSYEYGSVLVNIDRKANVSICGKSELIFNGKIGDE